MTELEKVEKLREKANVTFAEAKEALDKSNGDILDALIYLESQGKATVPAAGGFYAGTNQPVQAEFIPADTGKPGGNAGGSGESFADLMKRFGAFCLKMFNMGLSNHLVATKGEQHLFSCPVLVVIILVLCFFWITVPLFVISLFCGFNYRFSGDQFGKDAVNSVMDGASNVVADVKQTFSESVHKAHENANNVENKE